MAKTKDQKPKISEEEIRRLVVERLRTTMSPNRGISIGLDRSYTRDELIIEVEKGTRVGEKIITIELEFLQSLKDLPTYGAEISSDN